MLAIMTLTPGTNRPVVARTAAGSLLRSFNLPIELSGITLTINGAACGLKSVSQHEIVFVTPIGLPGSTAGVIYPVVLNNNGLVFKGNITFVPARPDIINKNPIPSPLGRARVFNVTNTVHTTEPFTVTTVKIRGGKRVPSVLRLHLTGVTPFIDRNLIQIRIGGVPSIGVISGPSLINPCEYVVDFNPPPSLNMSGDQPIIITVTLDGVTYSSRLDDSTSRISFL
jgi:hypothetical protein